MKGKRPAVSVIVPCYQSALTVERTMKSIQAQSFADWELIAVDDGSKDHTLEVLNRFAEYEPRMRVIHQENTGVSGARNAGQDAAKGEWLFFADADDHLLPHALEHLLGLADDETDIICGAYEMHFRDENGRREKHVCADGDRQCMLESLIRGDSALNSPCARLYRTEMIRKHRIRAPLGVRIGEDVLYNLDAFAVSRKWRISDEVIYIYEYGGDSAMVRAKKDRYTVSMPMIQGIGDFIDRYQMNTQLFRAHIDIYVRTLRVDRGRIGAAFALTYAMTRRMTAGVKFSQLPAKQKLYYLALRLMPVSSLMLP